MFFRSCKFAKIFSIEKKTCKRKILMILCIVLKPSIIYINIIYNLFQHIVRKICKFFYVASVAFFILTIHGSSHRRRIRQKRTQRSSMLVGERNCFNSLPHQRFCTRMIWIKGWIEEWILSGTDSSEKWMIIRFTPYQTTTLQKWMFFQRLFFESSFLLNN